MKKIVLKLIYNFLLIFSKIYLFRTKPYIIGITGNVGKTSCRMIINNILSKYLTEKTIYTSPKNFNSELGIIFSIFKIEKFEGGIFSVLKNSLRIIIQSLFLGKKYDILILEYGIDYPGDMNFLLRVAKPDISIFTKLGSIHVENFGSVEKIGFEKLKLIKKTKEKTYLNYADDFLRKIFEQINIEKYFFNKNKLNYSYTKEGNNIFSIINFDDITVKSNLLGVENFGYVELSFMILKDMGLTDFKEIQSLDLELQNGRFSIFEGINDSVLIDSTYNAGPESMEKMIDNVIFLREKLFSDYKLGFVIGDMRELGDFSEVAHKKLYEKLKNSDLLISIGQETKKYFPIEILNFLSSKQAGLYLENFLNETKQKYLILFKGSQNTIFVEESLKRVLLSKDDEKKLARQDLYWIEKKNIFFEGLK